MPIEASQARDDYAWRGTMRQLAILLGLLVLAFVMAIIVYWQVEGHEVLSRQQPRVELLTP